MNLPSSGGSSNHAILSKSRDQRKREFPGNEREEERGGKARGKWGKKFLQMEKGW
jgi:hypothetical protein